VWVDQGKHSIGICIDIIIEVVGGFKLGWVVV